MQQEASLCKSGMVDPEGAGESSKASRSHVRKLQLDLGLQFMM